MKPNGKKSKAVPRLSTTPLRRANFKSRVLDDYFHDLDRYMPVSQKEEQELFRKYHAGDSSMKGKIIRANLRFVIKVAQRYVGQGMPIEDLIAEGNAGLIHAVDKFEPDKNFKFISYAVWWIRQSILRALSMQSRVVAVPLNRTQRIVSIGKAIERLMQKGNRFPSVEDIAKETNLSEEVVLTMLHVMNPPSSLDSKIGEGYGDITIGDTLRSEESDPLDLVLSQSMTDELHDAMQSLAPNELEAVKRYYGFKDGYVYTLNEVGKYMGISRERVRQICERACKKMRETMEVK